MSKKFKITLIIVAVLIAGGYYMLKIFGEAFGADCEKSQNWTFKNYTIEEYKCLGWAGPPYYPLYLYKNGKEIMGTGHKLDSCTIRFISQKDLYLKFNICNNQVTELSPQKKLLELNQVDSIIMINIEQNKSKRLEKKDMRQFIQKWNKAPVFDFRDNENPFYPNSSYTLKVYVAGNLREFETGNFMIKDEDNWSYNFLEPREETNVKKFDDMWNKLKTTANNVSYEKH